MSELLISINKYLRNKHKLLVLENKLLMVLSKIKYSKRFEEFGKNSFLIKPIRIVGGEFISIGENVGILNGGRFEAIKEYNGHFFNPHISIGSNVSIGQNLHLVACSSLKIGHDVTISGNVLITDNEHEYKVLNQHVSKQPLKLDETIIGDYSFIGYGACILKGANLGIQNIVGANSVVVKGDYPDYCVLAGNPARIIKKYNVMTKSWESL